MHTTLGIDLASQPAKTGLCVIAWSGGRGEVRALARGTWAGTPLHDKLLSSSIQGLWGIEGAGGWGAAGRPVKVAIDAPLGWPSPFVEALRAHHDLQPWPGLLDNDRGPFERRTTDRFVRARTGKNPLSVSTDRIAFPAMRCAVILGSLVDRLPAGDLVRDGSGTLVEAYPDAALRTWLPQLWGVAAVSYKGAGEAAADRRRRIVDALAEELGDSCPLTREQVEACVGSDDCLDALACALLAQAAYLGQTVEPTHEGERRSAAVEGWIHLPSGRNLPGLAADRPG